jgi:hypothetical protein
VELQHQRVDLKAALRGRKHLDLIQAHLDTIQTLRPSLISVKSKQQPRQFLDRQHLAVPLLAYCPVSLTICRAVRLGPVARRQDQAGQQIYSTAS